MLSIYCHCFTVPSLSNQMQAHNLGIKKILFGFAIGAGSIFILFPEWPGIAHLQCRRLCWSLWERSSFVALLWCTQGVIGQDQIETWVVILRLALSICIPFVCLGFPAKQVSCFFPFICNSHNIPTIVLSEATKFHLKGIKSYPILHLVNNTRIFCGYHFESVCLPRSWGFC